MANTLRFKRGLVATIPTAALGEPLFTTDTFDLYIGNGTTNTRFQKYIASGATTQILRGDGSLYTFPLNISSPSNGQVLKYDGTNWVNSADAGVTGSGVAGQVTYWGSASTITGSNNLFWDATNNRLGIGTNTPSTNLEVLGGFNVTDGTTTIRAVNSGGLGLFGTLTNHDLALRTNNTQRARITASGNFIINNASTDNGLRFQVTGDGFFRGSGNTSGSNVLLLENSDGTDLLTILNNGYTRYGNAGVSAPRVYSTSVAGAGDVDLAGEFLAINLRSTTTATTTFGLLTINGLTGTATTGTQSVVAINKGFAPTSGTATYTALLYNATINQTGGANGITRGLYVNPTLTAAADWRSIEWSNNTGWGLYGVGTSNNYLGGSLGIGSTSLSGINLHITKGLSSAASANSVLNNIAITNVTDNVSLFAGFAGTTAGNLTNLFYYRCGVFSLGAGTTVTNMYGFAVQSGFTGATNNYGFYGDIASGTGRWNLYMNGTADNYLAGQVVIGHNGLPSSAAWTRALVVGNSGTDKVILGYLASSTNGATIGANNSGFSAWATLNISGSQLIFRTGETERMRLDSSGNLGLGVTPSAWSGFNAMQLSIVGLRGNTNTAGLSYNTYYDGTNFRYINNGGASDYYQNGGRHVWNYAPTGTAGNAITFTQAMTLFATGNLAIGTTTDAGFRLDVNGTMRVSGASTFNADMTLSKSTVAQFNITDTSNTTSTESYFKANAGTTESYFGSYGQSRTPYKIIGSGDLYIYKSRTAGNLSIINDQETGSIRMAAGGSSTAHFTLASTGAATFSSTISAAGQITGASGATEGKFNFLGYNGAYGGILSNTGLNSSYNAVYLYSNFNSARNGQGNSALPSYILELGGATPNNDSFSIQRSPAGSFTFSNLFKVDGTGAATFSSSVTATSYNATTQNIFSVGGTEGMRLTATNRNLHIGTFSSDSGEKLQVIGTAKIGTHSTTGYSLVVQNNGANDVSGIRISTGATVDGYLSLAYDATNTYGSIQAGDNNVFRNIVINRQGGSVGIGANPNNSAVLQADSTTRGFLPPRMTTTQRNAIPTPAAGLIVYDTTDNKHYGYDGTTWNAFY